MDGKYGDRTEVTENDASESGASAGRRQRKQGRRNQDRAREGDQGFDEQDAGREGGSVPDREAVPALGFEFPGQTPLYHAQHAARYERQRLITSYEERFGCRLVVMIDTMFPESVTLFEELLFDADLDTDLHVLLDSPGGDGETAVRLVRSAQSRCRKLVVLVPNQAKSAATLFAIGAHHIVMGPASDLGPVDPQFEVPGRKGLVPGKAMIAAVDEAVRVVAEKPESYPIYVSLLADITGVMVEQARASLGRSEDLVREALASNPDRKRSDVKKLTSALKKPLIDLPKEHGAIFGASDADYVGLPVIKADPTGDQWRFIWLLWTKYFALHSWVYEGRRASHVYPRPVFNDDD